MKMETCINQATPTLSQLWGDGITEPALEASHEGWLRSPQICCAAVPRLPQLPQPHPWEQSSTGWDWRTALLRSSMGRALFSKRSLNKCFSFPVTALHSQLLTALKMAPIEIIISY